MALLFRRVRSRLWKPSLLQRGHATLAETAALVQYQNRTPTPISIEQMLKMSAQSSRRLATAQLLQEELKIRLAQQCSYLDGLRSGLADTQGVQQCQHQYESFFRQVHELAVPKTPEDDARFVSLIRDIKSRDSSTLPTIARGIKEWRQRWGYHLDRDVAKQLDVLLTARLSIRMLMGQHVESVNTPTGRISRGLKVKDVAEEAIKRSSRLCLAHFGSVPDVVLEGNTSFEFTYVRSHLHHIIFELLKNSMRATIEHAERRGHIADDLPPIQIVFAGDSSTEDLVIKISDEGGGIPRSGLRKIWYTTAHAEGGGDQPPNDPEREAAALALLGSSLEMDPPVAAPTLTFRENFFGMGYGIPVSRVFARYFGGDLSVISTEGWGTDAYIHLNRLESSQVETLEAQTHFTGCVKTAGVDISRFHRFPDRKEVDAYNQSFKSARERLHPPRPSQPRREPSWTMVKTSAAAVRADD